MVFWAESECSCHIQLLKTQSSQFKTPNPYLIQSSSSPRPPAADRQAFGTQRWEKQRGLFLHLALSLPSYLSSFLGLGAGRGDGEVWGISAWRGASGGKKGSPILAWFWSHVRLVEPTEVAASMWMAGGGLDECLTQPGSRLIQGPPQRGRATVSLHLGLWPSTLSGWRLSSLVMTIIWAAHSS